MQVANLPDFMSMDSDCAQHRPADESRRICASTRLYAEAFAADPSLATDPGRFLRYSAACKAASAGCGRGAGASKLNDEKRACLRDQARTWLWAELAAWNKKLDSNPAAKISVDGALKRWQTEHDLAGLPEFKDSLPVAESRAWREMWKEIDAQIERARRQK